MKKKLIAALTSAAMVATMVPATAFAGTAVVTADNTPAKAAATVKAADGTTVSITKPAYTALQDGNLAKAYEKIAGEQLNAQLDDEFKVTSDDTISISGLLPYVENYWAYAGAKDEESANDVQKKLAAGNYMAITLGVEPGEYSMWGYSFNDEGLKAANEEKGSLKSYLYDSNSDKAENAEEKYKESVTEILQVIDQNDLTFTFYFGDGMSITKGSYENGTGAEITGAEVTKTITIDKSGLTLQTKDEKDIATVKELVAKIPAVEQITAKDAAAINAAYAAYEACSKEAKTKLDAERDTIYAAQDALQNITDKTAAQTVIDAIKALPNPITEDDLSDIGDTITKIENDYNKLASDDQRDLVTNYGDLKDAKAAAEVVELIKEEAENISDEVTADNYADGTAQKAVNAIKSAYDALKSAQGWVGNRDKYTSMVTAIAEFDQEVADADTVFAEVTAMLNKEEATQDFVDQAKAVAEKAQNIIDEWGDESPLLGKLKNGNKTTLDNLNTAITRVETQLTNNETAAAIIKKIEAIPAPADITINNMYEVKAAELAYATIADTANAAKTKAIEQKNVETIVNEAFGGNAKAVIDKAVEALKEELKGADAEDIVAAYKAIVDKIPAEPTLENEELVAVAEALKAELNGTDVIDPYVESDVSSVIKTNVTFKNAVGTVDAASQKIQNIKTANENALKAVRNDVQKFYPASGGTNPMKKITASDRQAIEAARAAYDALTADQKAYDDGQGDHAVKVYDSTVTSNVDKTVKEALEAVEKALAKVDADAEDTVAANALHKAIAALMPSAKLTLADKEKVDAVKADFDAASKGVQTLLDTSDYNVTDGTNTVTAATALNNAIAQINKLIADDVVKQIEALSAPSATDKDAIDKAIVAAKEAREAYEALTDEQKEQVTNLAALEGIESSISEAKVTYTEAQLTAAAKIDPANMSEADAKLLAEANELMTSWLTKDEAATLDSKVVESFSTVYDKYEETAMDLANAKATAIAAQTYTGKAIEPTVTLTDIGGKTIDTANYHVEYKNNVNAGKATIVVTGESGYTGRQEIEFTINPASLTGAAITVANQTYTGSALKPAVTVKVGDNTIAAENYDVAYTNNINAGTATVTITGKDNYAGTASKTFTIAKASISKASVTGVANRYYTGKARTQTGLKVTVAGKALSASNYSVKYANNKNVGKATLTITGQGNYTGTITKTFIVKPRKVSNVKVTKGKKRVTVRYKKQNGARYQIYYKKAGTKAKTVKTAAVKRTIKKLKSGKTYTIKVRAYKKIGSKTYYGKYSKAKKVRVR